MGTKESISYKMISHGSWYKQIEKERERESNSQDTRGGERKGNRQVKNKRRDVVRWRQGDRWRDGKWEGMSMCGTKRGREAQVNQTRKHWYESQRKAWQIIVAAIADQQTGSGWAWPQWDTQKKKQSLEDIVPWFKYTWAAWLQDSWWTKSHIKCSWCIFHSHVEGRWWTHKDTAERQKTNGRNGSHTFIASLAPLLLPRDWAYQPALRKQKLEEETSRPHLCGTDTHVSLISMEEDTDSNSSSWYFRTPAVWAKREH